MSNTTNASTATLRTDLHVDVWGDGTPVVLVHGSLATAAEEWDNQRSLTDQGFRFLAPDRRGYGRSPVVDGEDYIRDADDIAELMDGGVHLVGHSYGGMSVLLAAAKRPKDARSVAVLEAPVLTLGRGHPAATALSDEIRAMWNTPGSDEEFAVRFLRAVGSDPDEFPPDFISAALPLVPILRRGRPFWSADPPLDELAAGTFPKLVVSGGHHPGFDAICDDLAGKIGASRAVVTGAGHEIQFADTVNETLLAFWRSAT